MNDKNGKKIPPETATLRQKAEEKLINNPSKISPLSEADTQRLIHELPVHQIELEMQNEELKIAKEQSDRSLDVAMQVSNMAWWKMEMATGNVTFEKRKAEILGYPPEKFKHYTDFMALVHPEDYDRTMNAMQRHINGSIDKYEVEYRILAKSGEYLWFYDIGSAVEKDSKGNPVLITGLVLNISERKQTELIIKQQNNELEKLIVDKDRLFSILGHDLINPFNTLLGLSEVLKEDVHNLNTGEIEDIAKNINHSARTTYNLLESILMWARTQQGKIPFKPQNLSFTEICKNTIEPLNQNAIAKNITINYSTTDPLTVFADIDMLKTVLRNLVSNAIKFTNNGGIITINAEKNIENVIISVSDNGVGISPENLAKLFDISEVLTTKGTADETGTGLGLLHCRDFVKIHKGEIWVESEEGKGSKFKFTLPVSIEQPV